MKSLFLLASVLLIVALSSSQKSEQALGLPELHKIKNVTLSPNYGCRSKEDFQKGYGNTALFLSGFSYRFNAPDLLFNGACGPPDYLGVNMAGDALSVIADLGKMRLEDLKAEQVFNVQRVHSPELFSRFTMEVQPEIGHCYAVLINRSDARGIFYFTVTGYIPNERLDLRYVVKDYQLVRMYAESPGFDWEKRSD
jgi:hypothetical protein